MYEDIGGSAGGPAAGPDRGGGPGGGGGPAGIVDELTALCARLPAGSALPSTRELQRRHRASALTVQRALAAVAARGLLLTTPGRGSVVAAPPASRSTDLSWQTAVLGARDDLPHDMTDLYSPVPDGVLDLASAYLDPAAQPVGLLAAAAARAARRPGAWDRTPVAGLPDLRGLIAGLVSPSHTASDVLVPSGGQAALALVFRALGRPGEALAVEHTTYPGALAAARAAGLVPVPVPADGAGVRPDDLADVLGRSGARLVYLQPRHANPTGAVLAPDRRPAVLAALRDHRAFCVEDDWVAPLDLTAVSPPPLAAADPDGHVVHVLSLSKSVSPGLRIAAVTARGPVAARLARVRITDDLFVAPVLQQTAVELLSIPGWRRHLASLRRVLLARRAALLAAIARALPTLDPPQPPSGGVHVWLPLPPGADDRLVTAAARRAGVAVGPGSAYTVGEVVAPRLRLTYSRTSGEGLVAAVDRLAAVLHDG
ncbi:PLP-dependent aminotransferase family protein [Frankia sp. AvcI1]|uniref:aminotransferase-like domain-containing protein n=1 Tax=Frankia sp. AvcI1 TaxID=573496 RepID=UPI000AF6ABFD|nr:PLP-dependent aminotransferase family protein [Frankia sp. AvcI1]